MSDRYVAPYRLPAPQPPVPVTGEFLLPVCTTRDRYTKFLNAMNTYGVLADDPDLDFLIDVYRAMSFVSDECGCECYENQAPVSYPPSAPFITFAPGNPFDPDQDAPPGYPNPPWFLVGDTPPYFGLRRGDVVTDISQLFLGGVADWPNFLVSLPDLILNSGLPRFRVELNGDGFCQLNLLAVPQGGYALIVIDDDVSNYKLVNLRLISIGSVSINQIITLLLGALAVGSLEVVIPFEHEFTTPGAHHIDVTMIPSLNLDLLDSGYGGGLREVILAGNFGVPPVVEFRQNPANPYELQQRRNLCADWDTIFNYELIMPYFEMRVNPENDCEIQNRVGRAAPWTPVFDFSKCDAFKPRRSVTDTTTIINNIDTGDTYIDEIKNIYDGTPGSIAPGMNYDGSPNDDNRDLVLCLATRVYVDFVCETLIEMRRQDESENREILNWATAAFAAASVVFLTPLGAILFAPLAGAAAASFASAFGTGFGIGALATVFAQLFQNISTRDLEDPDMRLSVACCMYDNLKGQNVTFARWQASVDTCQILNENYTQIAELVAASLENQDAYLFFLQNMGQAADVFDEDLYADVPCFCDDRPSVEFSQAVFVAEVGTESTLKVRLSVPAETTRTIRLYFDVRLDPEAPWVDSDDEVEIPPGTVDGTEFIVTSITFDELRTFYWRIREIEGFCAPGNLVETTEIIIAESDWEQVFDFTIRQNNFSRPNDSYEGFDTLVGSSGIRFDGTGYTGNDYSIGASVDPDDLDRIYGVEQSRAWTLKSTITYAKLEFTYTRGNFDLPTLVSIGIKLESDGADVVDQSVTFAEAPASATEWLWAGMAAQINRCHFAVRSDHDFHPGSINESGSVTVTKLTLRGLGTNPFV